MKRKITSILAIICVSSILLNAYQLFKIRTYNYNNSERLKNYADSWANSITKSIDSIDNIFIGSSSTYLAPTDSINNSLNIGYWGENLKTITTRIDKFSTYRPERIFIFPSTNGYDNYDDDLYIYYVSEIVHKCNDCFPKSRIFVISTLPIAKSRNTQKINNLRIANINRRIESELSSKLNFTFIDVFTPLLNGREFLNEDETLDGLHLTQESYKVWLKEIKNEIYK